MTCLFIGNLIKATNESKLTSIFKQFGKCDVELKGPYAFVEYDNFDDAKEALKELNNTNLKGANGMARARIEFAKKKRGKGRLEENEISIDDYEDVFSDHSDDNISLSKKNINAVNDVNSNSLNNLTEKVEEDNFTSTKKRNVCFVCKLPGHFAKECALTKESCYECGEKGHIAKECHAGVREAKILTENRVKAIHSQQSAYKYITPIMKIKNIVKFIKSKSDANSVDLNVNVNIDENHFNESEFKINSNSINNQILEMKY
jgi:hypothetical protein